MGRFGPFFRLNVAHINPDVHAKFQEDLTITSIEKIGFSFMRDRKFSKSRAMENFLSPEVIEIFLCPSGIHHTANGLGASACRRTHAEDPSPSAVSRILDGHRKFSENFQKIF